MFRATDQNDVPDVPPYSAVSIHSAEHSQSSPLIPQRGYQNIQTAGDARTHLGDTYIVRHPLTQTLDFGRLETRFLEIEAELTGSNDEPATSPEHRHQNHTKSDVIGSRTRTCVACKLSTASLFECPAYVALSYSWDNHSTTRPIMLNANGKQVTASLEAALKELRRRGVDVVWVDGLCIDQDNGYEKAYQPNQMGKIFSKASKVVVWLGPAADDSDDAMHALSATENEDDITRHHRAIAKLLGRPYWHKVWTIQEIAKASVVEVWCGSQTLSWEAFLADVNGGGMLPNMTQEAQATYIHPQILQRCREAEQKTSCAHASECCDGSKYLCEGHAEKGQSLRIARHCPRWH